MILAPDLVKDFQDLFYFLSRFSFFYVCFCYSCPSSINIVFPFRFPFFSLPLTPSFPFFYFCKLIK